MALGEQETKLKASAFDKTQVINIITDENIKPRRAETKVGKIFAQYTSGDTVDQWLAKVKALGGGLSHLRKDVKYGRIELKSA
tara:strand:- start:3006 stop:3254 length:249 start_codon:yes stop_codon:yes gene_type:complete